MFVPNVLDFVCLVYNVFFAQHLSLLIYLPIVCPQTTPQPSAVPKPLMIPSKGKKEQETYNPGVERCRRRMEK